MTGEAAPACPQSEEEIAAAIATAHRLADLGVPLFLTRWGWHEDKKKHDWIQPRGWQNSPAGAASHAAADAWKPGMALCAVQGVITDALDRDQQHNGDWQTLANATAGFDGETAKIIAMATTPSGGEHAFVWTLGLKRKQSLVAGVDYQGQATFVYVAPTVKVSKTDGIARPYRWVKEPPPRITADAQQAGLTRLHAFVKSVHAAKRPAGSVSVGETDWSSVPLGQQDNTLAAAVMRWVSRGLGDAEVAALWHGAVQQLHQDPSRDPFLPVDFARHLAGAREKQRPAAPAAAVAWAKRQAAAPAAAPPPAQMQLPPPTIPSAVAEALVAGLWTDAAGRRTLRRWRGGWHEHCGTHWDELDDEAMKARLYGVLSDAITQTRGDGGQPETVNWNPSRAPVANTVEALAARVHMRNDAEESTGGGLVPLANGLLDWRARELKPHTPDYFCHYSLPFDYDPAAMTPPRWAGFLESVWPGDREAQMLLQEMFGYIVSGFTHCQKIFMIKGLRRSGKGTIAEVLKNLVGPRNTAGPTPGAFASEFGLQGLIGKPLAIVPDARNARTVDINLVIEKLLMISGEDTVSVHRKHRDDWVGQLPARIVILGNHLLNFKDASDAMSGRLISLETGASFFGREDFALRADLARADAMPGILNWALGGLARLEENGWRFTEPASFAGLRAEVQEKANPLGVFLDEECEIGLEHTAWADELFASWLMWDGGAKDNRSTRVMFGGDLKAAMASRGLPLERKQARHGGKQKWYYEGITLKDRLPAFMQ